MLTIKFIFNLVHRVFCIFFFSEGKHLQQIQSNTNKGAIWKILVENMKKFNKKISTKCEEITVFTL